MNSEGEGRAAIVRDATAGSCEGSEGASGPWRQPMLRTLHGTFDAQTEMPELPCRTSQSRDITLHGRHPMKFNVPWICSGSARVKADFSYTDVIRYYSFHQFRPVLGCARRKARQIQFQSTPRCRTLRLFQLPHLGLSIRMSSTLLLTFLRTILPLSSTAPLSPGPGLIVPTPTSSHASTFAFPMV